jgi:hypothetical protein
MGKVCWQCNLVWQTAFLRSTKLVALKRFDYSEKASGSAGGASLVLFVQFVVFQS